MSHISNEYRNILSETELPDVLLDIVEDYDVHQCSRLTDNGRVCFMKAEFEENGLSENCRKYCQFHCEEPFGNLNKNLPTKIIVLEKENPESGKIIDIYDINVTLNDSNFYEEGYNLTNELLQLCTILKNNQITIVSIRVFFANPVDISKYIFKSFVFKDENGIEEFGKEWFEGENFGQQIYKIDDDNDFLFVETRYEVSHFTGIQEEIKEEILIKERKDYLVKTLQSIFNGVYETQLERGEDIVNFINDNPDIIFIDKNFTKTTERKLREFYLESLKQGYVNYRRKIVDLYKKLFNDDIREVIRFKQ